MLTRTRETGKLAPYNITRPAPADHNLHHLDEMSCCLSDAKHDLRSQPSLGVGLVLH